MPGEVAGSSASRTRPVSITSTETPAPAEPSAGGGTGAASAGTGAGSSPGQRFTPVMNTRWFGAISARRGPMRASTRAITSGTGSKTRTLVTPGTGLPTTSAPGISVFTSATARSRTSRWPRS